jgi:hypothetical protein
MPLTRQNQTGDKRGNSMDHFCFGIKSIRSKKYFLRFNWKSGQINSAAADTGCPQCTFSIYKYLFINVDLIFIHRPVPNDKYDKNTKNSPVPRNFSLEGFNEGTYF